MSSEPLQYNFHIVGIIDDNGHVKFVFDWERHCLDEGNIWDGDGWRRPETDDEHAVDDRLWRALDRRLNLGASTL